MKRILGNLFWIILAVPFYVAILIGFAYAFIVLKGLGTILGKQSPTNP
jgi:hypothetical protein